MRQIGCMLGGLFFASVLCFAGDDGSKVRFSGGGGLELGQIVYGSYISMNPADLKEIRKGWQERFLYRLIYDMTLTERVRMVMDIEGQISFSYPQMLNPIESQATRFLFSPERIEGIYTLGNQEDPGSPSVQFGVGYFPYKFNPDARNLGELLFRSGTYPLYVITNFNHCYGKLLGLRVSSTIAGSLKQDILLTSEALMFPTQDYSLSYVAHYSLMQVLDMGAGISLAHFFSTEGKYTTNKTDPEGAYVKENGDIAYYSFKGIKPAAMLAFDPKPLLPSSVSDLLGKNDARLYGEVFVSGWENRKNFDSAVIYDTAMQMRQYYAVRSDRTVYMFGFNIPTFKLLDILSVEFEHFPNRYPNSFRNILERNLATPLLVPTPKQFAWKWSLYAKKTVLNKFFIVGQVARDHLRVTFPDIKLSEKEDQLKFGRDWWWVFSFNFLM